MSLEIVKKPNRGSFKDLNVGDVFTFCGEPYMKIEKISVGACDRNALQLSKGELALFSDDGGNVDLVRATLILQGVSES